MSNQYSRDMDQAEQLIRGLDGDDRRRLLIELLADMVVEEAQQVATEMCKDKFTESDEQDSEFTMDLAESLGADITAELRRAVEVKFTPCETDEDMGPTVGEPPLMDVTDLPLEAQLVVGRFTRLIDNPATIQRYPACIVVKLATHTHWCNLIDELDDAKFFHYDSSFYINDDGELTDGLEPLKLALFNE